MSDAPWLLLFHQLPSRPPYLRVKIWRLLRDAGAVMVRNCVYVLPATPESREAFGKIRRDIEHGRGQAVLASAHFVEGLADGEIRALFNKARNADYAALEKDGLAQYFAMARGHQTQGIDVSALEMTKWFDTNYHYLVPEIADEQGFRLASRKPFDEFQEASEQGISTRPVLIGPVSFLLLAKKDGKVWAGKLGATLTTEEGKAAAHSIAIDLLATLHAHVGDLNRVTRIVKLMSLVNSTLEFTEQHLVTNGASELIADVFGERGKHARSAFGVAQIPLGACVEIELIAEVG